MAFRSFSVTVPENTRTLVLQAGAGDVEMWLDVDTTTTTFYVGGDDVTTSNGLRLVGTSAPALHSHIRPGDELYAITGTIPGGTSEVNILVRSA